MLKGVTKEQKLLLLSTFVVGMVSGSYLYLTVYAPTYRDGLLPDRQETVDEEAVSVRAAQYGDCISSGFTCPSFEIDAEGVLHAAPPTSLEHEAVVETSRLRNDDLSILYDAIYDAPLAEFSALSPATDCASAPGDHYRYVIFLGSENVILDTCRTAFREDSALSAVLMTFFDTEPVLE